jgi:4-amino-4-deoxy-L-arabinose transferase-like glycosyltransferase
MTNRRVLASKFTFIGYSIGPTIYLILAALSGLNPGTYDWDELVYLARSKDLSQGFFYQSGDYWGDYRAPGLPVLLTLAARLLGYDENRLVLLPIFLGFVSILLVGYIVKELAGRTASIVAMATLPLLPFYVLTNSGFYADTAGTTFSLLTVAAAMYFAKQEKYRVVTFTLVLVFLGALSTYMRYGAVFTIVPLLIGVFFTQYLQINSHDRMSLFKKWTTFSLSIGIGTLLIYLNPYITLLGDSPAEANSALTVDREDLSAPIAIRGLVKLCAVWFESRTSLETIWLRALVVLLITLITVLFISRKNSTLASYRNSYIWLAVFVLQLALLATQVGLMSKNYFLIFTPTLAILFGMFAAELNSMNLSN